ATALVRSRRLLLMACSSRLIRRHRRQPGQIFGYPSNGFVVDKRSWKGRHGVEAIADENFHIRLRQAAPGYRRSHANFGGMTVAADFVIEILAAAPLAVILLRLARCGQHR